MSSSFSRPKRSLLCAVSLQLVSEWGFSWHTSPVPTDTQSRKKLTLTFSQCSHSDRQTNGQTGRKPFCTLVPHFRLENKNLMKNFIIVFIINYLLWPCQHLIFVMWKRSCRIFFVIVSSTNLILLGLSVSSSSVSVYWYLRLHVMSMEEAGGKWQKKLLLVWFLAAALLEWWYKQ